MNIPFVKQIRTGKIKQLGQIEASEPMNRPWETAIYKELQEGRVLLMKTGLQGDQVANPELIDDYACVLFAYPAHHYEFWLDNLQVDKVEEGNVGENLVVDNADEFTTFVGDTFQFGEAIIQVSQPYEPNWHQSYRVQNLDFALRMQETGRTGWCYRVIEEGYVQAGVDLHLIDRPHPEWSIAAVNEVLYEKKDNLRLAYELSHCAALSLSWRRMLSDRLKGRKLSFTNRLYRENVD